MSEKILIIGHCCHDKIEDQFILGGSASYASILSQALGLETSVVTSVGQDFMFHQLFQSKSIEIINKLSDLTTCFENIRTPSGRLQNLHAKAENIVATDVDDLVSDKTIVFLCPIADEISFDVIPVLNGNIIGASIQGWLRSWGTDGLIEPKLIDWSQLDGIDILFFSEEDFDYQKYMNEIQTYVKHIVVTKASDGADVYYNGEMFWFGSYQTKAIDSTGAGDTFSTAYLIEFARNQNVESACVFAHCAASIVIEGIGLSTVPDAHSILDRISIYPGS